MYTGISTRMSARALFGRCYHGYPAAVLFAKEELLRPNSLEEHLILFCSRGITCVNNEFYQCNGRGCKQLTQEEWNK